MAKGSLRVNGIIVDTDGEIKASTGDSIVIREDDGSAVITVDTNGKTSIGGPMDVGVDDTGHDVKFFGATAGAYMLWDESQDDLIIGGAGRVGIGTTAPSAPLNIRSDSATVGGIPLITLENLQADGTASTGAHINFFLDNTNSENTGGSIGVVEDGNDGYAELVFKTTPASNSSTLNERMRITSDGKVGIGTTSPSGQFHVHGSESYAYIDGSTVVITRIYDGVGSGDFQSAKGRGTIASPTAVQDGDGLWVGSCRGHDGTAMKSAGSMKFSVDGTVAANKLGTKWQVSTNVDTAGQADTAAVRMTIKHNGKVGIGTTAPGNQLVVSTSDYMDSGATYPYNGATLHLKTTATNTNRGCGIAFSDGTEDKGFISMNDTGSRGGEFNVYARTSGGTVNHMMKIPSSGSVQVNGGSVASISDYRIKKDITDLTDGLNIVNQLKPRTFKFNGKHQMAVDDGETHYGFVADEVLSVASQYVELTKDNIDGERLDDVKTISTGKMIPMLVNAVKELSAEVTALKNAG